MRDWLRRYRRAAVLRYTLAAAVGMWLLTAGACASRPPGFTANLLENAAELAKAIDARIEYCRSLEPLSREERIACLGPYAELDAVLEQLEAAE